jgi:hypothetical protein
MKDDRLGRRKSLQSLDSCHHFHSIVRCVHRLSGPLRSLLAVLNDVGPAPGAGIPEATAVGKDLYHA